MENVVVMSLRDYNALKRKADALEQAVSIQVFSTWVDCKVDPKALEPLVKNKIKEAIADGVLDEDKLLMKPAKDWFNSITVAEVKQDTEE